MSASIFDGFLTTPEAAAVFSDVAVAQAMFDFEAALARAQAAEHVIPAAAATAIAGVCRAQLYDLAAMVAASGRAGSLAIPLVKELTRTVALFDTDSAGFVHWGSTSQDVIDTAMALCTKRALALIDAQLAALAGHLLTLAEHHADTPVLARTLLQPALVTSFGLKCANWAAPVVRARARLREAASRAIALQLGGAAGTLSAMGERAPQIARRMAEELQLTLPPTSWHTQRDEWVRLGCEVAVCVGSLGKIGTDLALMAQGEIAELAEPAGAGRGGSSTMPNKRNPVSAMVAIAASHRTPMRAAALLGSMAQPHERGLGEWQAELAEWPGLYLSAHGAAHALAEAFAGLQVDARRMRRNIDGLGGAVYAEAASMVMGTGIGRAQAHELMQRLTREAHTQGRELGELVAQAIASDAKLRERVDAAAVARCFNAETAVRSAAALARRLTGELRAALRA